MDKPQVKPDSSRDAIRALARDMAALLELTMEIGSLPRERVLPLLERWAQVEHMAESDAGALRVRLHRLIGHLEADFITARLAVKAPDAHCLLTVGMARDWMAGAFREAIVQVRNHFPDQIVSRVGDAYSHIH